MIWTDYKGKSILTLDFSGLEKDLYPKVLEKITQEINMLGLDGRNKLLVIARTGGSPMSKETLAMYRKAGRTIGNLIKANAVVGVQGFRKHIVDFLRPYAPFEISTFETEEEAMEWLVSQE